jgi:hypothetical protein
MTFVTGGCGVVAGGLASFWLILAGAILRWIVQPQWFPHAYQIGDAALWLSLAIIVLCTLVFGLLGRLAEV